MKNDFYSEEEFFYKSSNGVNDIYAKIYIPNNTESIKGVIQFCHGMGEYFNKYKEFYEFMLKKGFIVCGNDMLGHGSSVKYDSDRGFFALKDGYKYLVADVKKLSDIMKLRFSPKFYFMIGHSMGSLIARNYVEKYGKEINGLIILRNSWSSTFN